MPTYQYRCTECGGQLEAVQKFTDEPLSVCAACGGRLRKVFSPVGIVFKGSGFYRTDSRNGSVPPASDAKKDKQDKQSSESKPASDGNGSADKTAAKKSETVSTAAKSSSSEKVA